MIDISQIEKVPTDSDLEKESNMNSARLYLQETDWYFIRFLETKQAIPDDVATKRQDARDVLNEM